MKKLKRLRSKWRFAEETVYIFSELKKRQRAREAMRFYEMKIAIQVALCILLAQGVIMTILCLY